MKQTPIPASSPSYNISFFYSIALITWMFTFTGCATIFTGTRQKVTITSSTTKAKVLVNGVDRGTTPIVVKLKRGHTGQIVTVSASGYESRTFQPETSFNLASLGNIIFLPGFGFDILTGALWRYHPKYYDIELEKRK